MYPSRHIFRHGQHIMLGLSGWFQLEAERKPLVPHEFFFLGLAGRVVAGSPVVGRSVGRRPAGPSVGAFLAFVAFGGCGVASLRCL